MNTNRISNKTITLFKKNYEIIDLVHYPSKCTDLLEKKITDKFIIINFQKKNKIFSGLFRFHASYYERIDISHNPTAL